MADMMSEYVKSLKKSVILAEIAFVGQGYAAREFAHSGLLPGELAIISKEAVSIFLSFIILSTLVE